MPSVEPFTLPVINLDLYRSDPTSSAAQAECQKCAAALRDYGALVVRDQRVTEADNANFIDMMEDYFDQPFEVKMQDIRPELGYQIGTTPENTEDPKCKKVPACLDLVQSIPEENRPLESIGPDPKWRFFWRIGELPSTTKYPALNAEPVIPKAFADTWAPTMNKWGSQMHESVVGIAEMSAVGFGLPRTTFVDMVKYGPHLLAPTASDLNKYGEAGTILAGFHYDLNFLTIHGKSRFPGLHIWPRNGKDKVSVRVPDGCLLVQAGKQMEYLTGGVVKAGYHEVVVTERTMEVVEQRKRDFSDRPLWRISSTFFLHIASDQVLRPLEPVFGDGQGNEDYPRKDCGILVKEELGLIELMK